MAGKSGKNGQLERITVNFIRRTSAALRLGMQVSGDTATDVINRYVQIGAFYEWGASRGTRFFMQEPGDDQLTRIIMLPGGNAAGDSALYEAARLAEAAAGDASGYPGFDQGLGTVDLSAPTRVTVPAGLRDDPEPAASDTH